MHAVRLVVTAGVAVATFVVAYENGSFGTEARGAVAIGVWWTILLLAVFGFGSWELSRGFAYTAVLFAVLAAFTLASAAWGGTAESALDRANLASLYVGLYVLGAWAASAGYASACVDGLTLALPGITLTALASRVFPGLFSQRGIPEFLPDIVARLGFPIGYWNGLAVFVSLSLPLLLRVAMQASALALRAAAVGIIPLSLGTLYLTSSRGGFVSAGVAVLAMLWLTRRRWTCFGAIAVAGLGSAVAVHELSTRDALVNGPLGGQVARSQGHAAAVLLVAIGFGTAALFAAFSMAAERGAFPRPRRAGWLVAAVVTAFVVGGIASVHPVRRFEDFKALPSPQASATGAIQSHLASGSGNGRWQLWDSALDEFRTKPVGGRGAGSFEAWWAQHGTIPIFVRDAHSLYFETLGELGIVGLLLVLGAFGVGTAAGISSWRASSGRDRELAAALIAIGLAFIVAVAFDWIWQIPAVAGVGVAALGLAGGLRRRPGPQDRRALILRRVMTLAAVVAVLLQAPSLLATARLQQSREHASRAEWTAAADRARAAKRIEPWAATPRLQLALVHEGNGQLADAIHDIRGAIHRAPDDWRLWLVRARLETKTGRIGAARVSLHRALSLNPHSPIISPLGGG